MGIMTKVFKEEPSDYTYHITGAAFLRVILMAAGAGLATWLLVLLTRDGTLNIQRKLLLILLQRWLQLLFQKLQLLLLTWL